MINWHRINQVLATSVAVGTIAMTVVVFRGSGSFGLLLLTILAWSLAVYGEDAAHLWDVTRRLMNNDAMDRFYRGIGWLFLIMFGGIAGMHVFPCSFRVAC